jgi:hypothetical protein
MKGMYCFIIFLLLLPVMSYGQETVVRLLPFDGQPATYINAQLAADTAANHGLLPNRVYELDRDGYYFANRTFMIPTGQTLVMRAAPGTGQKPIILLYPTGTGANPNNPPGWCLDVRGKLFLTNIVVDGYDEDFPAFLSNLQGGLINVPTAGAGASLYLDGCILVNCNGNFIRTDGATKVVIVTNSIFTNMGFLGTSNLGAGKGIDLRATSCDSVIFENCSFVNWQDRIIRHYNLANPLAGTSPISYLRFNHNTLVNGMSYHGLLSLGSLGREVIITNNLFVDAFALGNDSDAARQIEFIQTGELDPYGGPRITWIFSANNDTTQWTIANNYYSISDSGQAFYDSYASVGVTGEGSMMSHHINGRLGADSVNAFKKVAVNVNSIPKLMTKEMRWYRSPSGGNKTKNTPNATLWNLSYDYDRKSVWWLLDTLNCSYSSGASIVSSDGQAVGDPRWTFTQVGIEENRPVPTTYSLNQNFPNPFNPSTRIEYSLPNNGVVTLNVYNTLGQVVATLVNERQESGYHAVTLDGSDLSSGVYFYQITAGKFTATKKMMLVK